MGLLQRLFGSPARSSGVRADEDIDDLHAEFTRTFCHRPGVNFIDWLRVSGATRLIEWLRPTTPCPLPKGFVRLTVDGLRRGIQIWDQPGVSMVYEGNWSNGGLPAATSLDALSALAQALGKPIKLYFQERPDGPQLVREFEP